MKSPILVSLDPDRPYTLFIDTSRYAWSAMLTQEHATVIDSKTLVHQHPITYVSGLFQGSQLNWTALTIYMADISVDNSKHKLP